MANKEKKKEKKTKDIHPKKMFPKDEFYIEDTSSFGETKWIILKIKEKMCTINSEYKKIVVFDSYDYGRMMVIDDSIQTAESDEYIYHEVMIHPPLIMHPNPKSVLIIGGGDGGSLEEILKHKNIESVTMAELDKMVIEASRKYLPSISKGAFDDPRAHVHLTEGRHFIETTDKKFDVIYLDLTDPSDHSKLLYTKEFYELVTTKLTPGGLISLHLSAWHPFPKVTGTIYKTLKAVFPHVHVFSNLVPSYGMELAFCYSSPTTDVKNFSPQLFAENFEKRLGHVKNELKWIDGDFLQTTACFQPKKLKESFNCVDRISTDANPLTFDDFYNWDVEAEE